MEMCIRDRPYVGRGRTESIASFLFHIAFIKINVPLDIIINDNLIYSENDEEERIIWNWQRL